MNLQEKYDRERTQGNSEVEKAEVEVSDREAELQECQSKLFDARQQLRWAEGALSALRASPRGDVIQFGTMVRVRGCKCETECYGTLAWGHPADRNRPRRAVCWRLDGHGVEMVPLGDVELTGDDA